MLFCAHARAGAVLDALEGSEQLTEAQKRALRGVEARLGLRERTFARPAKIRHKAVGRKRDPFVLNPEEVASALEVRMLSAHEYLLSKVMLPAIDQVETHAIPATLGCDVEVTVSGDHVLLSASQTLDYLALEQQGSEVQRLPSCEQLAVDLRGTLFFFPVREGGEDLIDFCLLVARRGEIRSAVERHFVQALESRVPSSVALFCFRQRAFILESVLGGGSGGAPQPVLTQISPRKRFVQVVRSPSYGEEISLSASSADAPASKSQSAAPLPVSQLPPYGL